MIPSMIRELYLGMPRANVHRLYVRRRPLNRRRGVRRDELAVARWSFTFLWAMRKVEVVDVVY